MLKHMVRLSTIGETLDYYWEKDIQDGNWQMAGGPPFWHEV